MAKKKVPKSKAARAKVKKTMHEFKHGKLKSGSKSGPRVKDRAQAVAIALEQARKAGKAGKKKSRARK
jgi:hypothetical protein